MKAVTAHPISGVVFIRDGVEIGIDRATPEGRKVFVEGLAVRSKGTLQLTSLPVYKEMRRKE
jgi:hypothetical protein